MFTGSRTQIFSHMFTVHKFNIGYVSVRMCVCCVCASADASRLPDNIVNISELLDTLQSKIDKYFLSFCLSACQCVYIYCGFSVSVASLCDAYLCM